MRLAMYVGNDFIAAVQADPRCLSLPGYVGTLKRRLISENQETLLHATADPVFLVDRNDIGEKVCHFPFNKWISQQL